ncbi:MAG: cytidylate kinase-like family protein [Anaerolineae bacterium]
MAVITISRQYGSGGTEIAMRVSEMLDCSYLDKLIMTQIAEEVGLSMEDLGEFSEEYTKVKNFLLRIVTPGPHTFVKISIHKRDTSGEETASTIQLNDARCAALVRSAVHRAYQRGNAVIVGRGGQATLQDMPGVLHVRIEAPLKARVLRVQQREGLGIKEAERLVKYQDRIAEQYLRHLFGIRWDDSSLYHVVINTAKWDMVAAAQLIADLAKRMPSDKAIIA